MSYKTELQSNNTDLQSILDMILALGSGDAPATPEADTLDGCSWENIAKIASEGNAANYWSVGDRKAVTLNGTVGSLTFSDETYYAYIISIDHNSSIEGTNRIHFQFGYSAASGGVHLAFIDSTYGSSSYSACFHMNSSNTNSGGWSSSYARGTLCTQFKSAMPSDLQAVLKATTKYSDNTGGGSDTASYVTATSEEVFLLAEFEVFGARSYANSAEKNYQAQYAWYSAGNSKVRYRHSATGSTAAWWLRSVYADGSGNFCIVGTSGGADISGARNSRGFAPAFCV